MSLSDESENFSEIATMLSTRVVAFQEHLRGLPGKVKVEYSNGTSSLRFDREGKDWFVFYTDSNCPSRRLTGLGLRHKVIAADLMEHLLRKCSNAFSVSSAEMTEAIKKIDKILDRK